MTNKIKKGDTVRIHAEFQDQGDDKFTWVALCDEEKGRVDISPVDIGLNILPVYTVKTEWVALV